MENGRSRCGGGGRLGGGEVSRVPGPLCKHNSKRTRRELISARMASHKHDNKDTSRLRKLSPGKRVNTRYVNSTRCTPFVRVQELCESRGGRPGLSILTSLTVSVDVKQH